MRKIIFGAALALMVVFGFRYCEHRKDDRERVEANTALIQKQLRNVGKLVVTEGSYAQVFTYSDSKDLLLGLVKADKKALVVIDAKATVAYDLSKLVVTTNPEKKKVIILFIPEPELTINPNLEYYDIQADYLNEFTANDYNIVKKRVENELRRKIEKSELMTNAQNRLISELQKIYVLTNSMGWTLEYDGTQIESSEDFKGVKL